MGRIGLKWMVVLYLYNSLTRKKEKFTPLDANKVKIYVCGITPYDTTHLGHAFTYISFDVLVRYLGFLGYSVEYTQNVTDINDRDSDILQKAKEQNVRWDELGDYWTERFLSDMKFLNWRKPDHYIKASSYMPQMIEIINKLLANGSAYQKNGSVYLDISRKKDFGKLSRLKAEEMLKLAKQFEEDIENPDKKNPLDITLWRSSKPSQAEHIPSFDSPWGSGRPGWHLECSTMAISTLGEQIDIHGGGEDLVFPHHEAEIAQSEMATGKTPFSAWWLHTGAVYCKGQKMSKSLGNLVMISDLLADYSPSELRWILLSRHYRQQWEFQEKDLAGVKETVKKIKNQVLKVSGFKNPPAAAPSRELEMFSSLMNDDLNTPEVLRFIESQAMLLEGLSPQKAREKAESLYFMLNILGFSPVLLHDRL